MTLLQIDKQKVIKALLQQRMNYDSTDAKFAEMYGINPAVFSQVKKGKTDGLISDDNIVSIAAMLDVSLIDAPEWKVAQTRAFIEYTNLMRICQQEGASRIICDEKDRGKSTAAKWFMLNNKNVFYVDCSKCKGYREFIKALAKSMGLPTHETLSVIRQRIERFLLVTKNPLVLLDEFGDLNYTSFLEIKSLWNGTEMRCAWVAMGAQGLKKKIEKGVTNEKIGFEEFLRRFGSDFMTATPPTDLPAVKRQFFMAEAEIMAGVNMPGVKVKDLIATSESRGEILSLTRVKEKIIKMKREQSPALKQGKLLAEA